MGFPLRTRVIALDMFTSGKIEGVEEGVFDIHNHEQLVEALKDADLVFNTVGPYFAHGTAVADASLASTLVRWDFGMTGK